MPAPVYIGLYISANDEFVWTFTSRQQAAKCFGYKGVQPTMNKPLNAGDKYIKAGHEKYYLKMITKEQLQECKTDSSKLEHVHQLVQGNLDWDLDITETMQECLKCNVVKPWTEDFFSVESHGLRKTCRECRNNHVRERAEVKMLEVEEQKSNGVTTFKCMGYGSQGPHDANIDQHVGDRDQCRDCKNARGKADYSKTAEPGAIAKLRAQLAGQTAECNMCHVVKDIGREFCIRPGFKGYRPFCLDCRNEKADYKIYRKRKREMDEGAFLRHNAEVLRNWHARNPGAHERWRIARRKDADVRFKAILKGAAERGIPVDMGDQETLKSKLGEPCAYCGHIDPDGNLNGLDRVINSEGYTDANTVPSCHVCNLIKRDMPLGDFVVMVERIAENNSDVKATAILPTTNFGGVASSVSKTKTQELAKMRMEEFNAIDDVECYLCGTPRTELPGNIIGVDRINSDLDYFDDNCMPCCSTCNYAKKDYKLDEFLGHIQRMNDCLKNMEVDELAQTAASSSNAEQLEIPNPPKRRKPTLWVPHARAVAVRVVDNRTRQVVAKYQSFADTERALDIANLRTLFVKNNGLLRKHWNFTRIDQEEYDETHIDPEINIRFVNEFKSKAQKSQPEARRGVSKKLMVVIDGVEQEFESTTALARHFGVTEGAVRKAMKKDGKVKGCDVKVVE